MPPSNGLILAVPERWDEACFAVPTIRALSKSGILHAIICREEQELFWSTTSSLPRFLYSSKSSPANLAKQLGNNWETSLTWDSQTPATAFLKAKIPKRLGPTDSPLTKLFTNPLQITEKTSEHRTRRYINTALSFDIQVNQPEYFTPAPIGIQASPNSVLLCPESDFGPSHEWPLDRWQELAEALLDQGKIITIAGGLGGNRGHGKILANRLGNDVEFFHTAPLAAAIPHLAAHQIVIAADGSLPHLAAHAGSTCVTLFGPNDPSWKRPLGKHHVVLKKHVECAPCLSPKCLMDLRCQTQLEVSKVLSSIPKSF
jgi:ADP-heptose:LPS heptosyltransferase